jgi:hypothetical protein
MDLQERQRVLDEGLGVHVSHFQTTDDYETTDAGRNTGTIEKRPKKAAVATPEGPTHGAGRMSELRAMGVFRSAVPYASAKEAGAHALKILQQAAPPAPWFDEEYSEPKVPRVQSVLSSPDSNVTGKSIWELLRIDSKCWWYTGEENYELLELFFKYINADRAFTSLRMYRKDRAGKDRYKGGGRRF